ncbi:MAG: MmgE/PrpD family protein [Betaproteobacteria bacterium]|nr:MmgE/PrpD family protein [Betaproteobacteria bacterium]
MFGPAYARAASGFGQVWSAGWIGQAGVTTALLADMEYEGDKQVLEGDFGFLVSNDCPPENWDAITADLGHAWNVLETRYKYWPCCGNFQSPLEAFTKLITDNDLKPEEMEQVTLKVEGQNFLPRYHGLDMENHVDAQFSPHYNIAVAAHRVRRGPDWQARSTIANPGIRDFMKRVTLEVYPRCEETRHQEIDIERRKYIDRRPSCVEVTARGKVYAQATEYAKWLSVESPEYRATDEGLADKFRANTYGILDAEAVETAIDTIMNLESVNDIGSITRCFVKEGLNKSDRDA